MKANELMIGDWVRIKGPSKYEGCIGTIETLLRHKEDEGAYFKVFLREGVAIGLEDIYNEDIEPIPLTAEILEKNGIKWLSTEPSGRITYISIEPPIIATWLKDHWLVSVGPAGSKKMPYVEIGWLNYVHQLQHAFHDCGIDKEIVLNE